MTMNTKNNNTKLCFSQKQLSFRESLTPEQLNICKVKAGCLNFSTIYSVLYTW